MKLLPVCFCLPLAKRPVAQPPYFLSPKTLLPLPALHLLPSPHHPTLRLQSFHTSSAISTFYLSVSTPRAMSQQQPLTMDVAPPENRFVEWGLEDLPKFQPFLHFGIEDDSQYESFFEEAAKQRLLAIAAEERLKKEAEEDRHKPQLTPAERAEYRKKLLEKVPSVHRLKIKDASRLLRLQRTVPVELSHDHLPMGDKKNNFIAFSRLLSLRRPESPFTLVIDDLNQNARPLIEEFERRARSIKANVVIVSFDGRAPSKLLKIIDGPKELEAGTLVQTIDREIMAANGAPSLLIIDSLHVILENPAINIAVTLTSLMHANSNIVAVYHTDVPTVTANNNPYAPAEIAFVKCMATTIVTCRSLKQVLAAKAAEARSLPRPNMGILDEAEGVVQALDANTRGGLVLETEFRRKSGTVSHESFFLRKMRPTDYHRGTRKLKKEFLILLEEQPEYKKGLAASDEDVDEGPESTFNLGLTEKQKKDREGVVLPYFDAQMEGGGEGGRILYEMTAEDDFDEEEDEI